MKAKTLIIIVFFLSLITFSVVAFMAYASETCTAICPEGMDEKNQDENIPGLMIWENLPVPINASSQFSF
ncbi:MAG: hypothetical protein H0V30_12940 [Chitinophagaceae bacterium]|jgi:hypothetical protein|nr:hypothetical protein [Chitinophagaceae bacterium]